VLRTFANLRHKSIFKSLFIAEPSNLLEHPAPSLNGAPDTGHSYRHSGQHVQRDAMAFNIAVAGSVILLAFRKSGPMRAKIALDT
jgi:hypothetical protein